VGSDLVLDGPVDLYLTASTQGLLGKDTHPHVYLQDCAADGTGCTVLAATDVHVNSWSGLFSTWAERRFTIGTVDHTVAGGRVLRVTILADHHDLWIAMSASDDSRVELTLG
jgi:hypothetical protein